MRVNKFMILLIIVTLLLTLCFTLTSNSSLPSSADLIQANKIYLAWQNSGDAVAYEMEVITKP